jgi:acetylornithine deacetylase
MTPGPISRSALTALLSDLVRIPSVNPVLAPGEGRDERAIAGFARDWLAARGVEAWVEEVAPGRANCVARAGASGGPTLVLCAHLDTVGTDGMTIAPFEPRQDGGRIYGRGSYDMKGGVAAAMAATAEIARAGIDGTVLLALVCDEEHASLGAQHFVRDHSADAAVLTEPSEGRLVLTHKGFVWIECTTSGRAAHGSRWDLGDSAIARMGRVVAALDEFDRNVLRARTAPLLGPASIHCGMIRGGSGISTYAASCRVQIERRTLPGETAATVMAELRDVVRAGGEPEAELSLLLDRAPLATPADAPIAVATRSAATQVLGRPPEEIGVGYWMDAAIFAEAGIPTVNFGPAGAGAHEPVEWVDLDSVEACARVLVEAARTFCGRSAA